MAWQQIQHRRRQGIHKQSIHQRWSRNIIRSIQKHDQYICIPSDSEPHNHKFKRESHTHYPKRSGTDKTGRFCYNSKTTICRHRNHIPQAISNLTVFRVRQIVFIQKRKFYNIRFLKLQKFKFINL